LRLPPAAAALASPSSTSSAPGATAPAGTGAGAPGAQLRRQALLAYLDRVIPIITTHIIYPEEAERLGLEDTFVLRIAVDRGGHLRSARLIGRAPHGLLERSAFAALAASAPLPPPAPELGPLVELDVPFNYRLDGGG
jgi:TonB family protein